MCAHDLHTTAPGSLERTCWRQFAAQWGVKNLKLHLWMRLLLLLLLLLLLFFSSATAWTHSCNGWHSGMCPAVMKMVVAVGIGLTSHSGVLTVFAHHWFANQSDSGRIIPSSLFARLANQYFGISEQSVTNKSFRNTRLSGRLHYEPYY